MNHEHDIVQTLKEAFAAAAAACYNYLQAHPKEWYPCGFAWVRFDGRSPVVRVLKRNFPDRGHKGYPRGWDIWDPANMGTQSMQAKLAGADAFVRVMRDAGFECHADSRMD